MTEYAGLAQPQAPDAEALIANIRRQGTPARVHHMELFHDWEIKHAVCQRFGLMEGVAEDDPHYAIKQTLAMNRFCGFDHVSSGLVDTPWPVKHVTTDDTADLAKSGGRSYTDEHAGPITNWAEFETYPWPDPHKPEATRDLEWLCENLPEGMCIACHTGHFCEFLCWLMGYETLCFALYDQRDLVEAIAERVLAFHRAEVARYLEFEKVRIIWGSDDMGYKTGLMFSAEDMRKFVLAGHRQLAAQAHEAGRVYLLHSCGNLAEIIDDLTDDVRIDGKHSFEDTIEDVREAKNAYGRKTALIGGVDVDFLCRATPEQIRRRVRDTLDVCLPGGGYCLGSGNSVANYVPVDNYLAMIDEGRLYAKSGD